MRPSRAKQIAVGCVSLLAVFTELVFLAPKAAATPASLPVIPTVHAHTAATGTFTLTSSGRIMVDTAKASQYTTGVSSDLLSHRTLMQVAACLAEDLLTKAGVNVNVVTGTTPAAGDIFLTLAANGSLGTEGYTEDIGSSILISSPTSTGVFYAGQSLLQQFSAASSTTIDRGSITDSPDVGYRAMMLDVGRRIWPVGDVLAQIRRMAWMKLNVLQLHFNEDEAFRLDLAGTSYSGLAPTSEAYHYSKVDIDTILAFAKKYHVTVIPEIDTPAHALPIAVQNGQNRSLQAKCGSHYAQDIDITDSSVVAWVAGLYSTVATWFPDAPYFHIGGDEVEQLDNCSYIASSGKTGAQWQTEFENSINDAIVATGKRSMMWANNLDIQPDLSVIITVFNNTDASFRALGYDVIDEPATVSSGMPDAVNTTTPDLYSYSPPTGAHAMGPMLPVWADAQTSGNDSNFTLPETLLKQDLLAERSWNTGSTGISYTSFKSKKAAIGTPPGVVGAQRTPVTTNGQPVHKYSFDNTYVPPNRSQANPDMWSASLGPVRVGEDISSPDSAGSLYAIAQYGKPVFNVSSRSGNAIQFTNSSESFTTIPDGDNPISWTITAWVKRTGDRTYSSISSNHFGELKMEQWGSSHKVGFTRPGVADYSFNYSVPLNTWTHLALVSDGAAGVTTLYVNGASVDSVAATIELPVGTIGGKPAYLGLLDDFTIYNQALNASQVAGDYSGVSISKLPATATASSTEGAGFAASNAVDDDASTRWSSLWHDGEYITLDLGATKSVSRIELIWQYACANHFEVRVSTNGSTWSTAKTSVGAMGFQTVENLSASARYVRIFAVDRATPYGVSLFDVSVYGS